jgi:hypothetical protein
MKTRRSLLFVIAVIAAGFLGFIIGISVNFPKPDTGELAGTIGKANKYHKTQMTAADIKLRTELSRDTAQLRSMIDGLVYFSLFTEELVKEIDMGILVFRARGMETQAATGNPLNALQDYSDYLRNNNQTLGTTVSMLTGLYLNDTSGLSQDVEKNLREFGGYVSNLNKKNLVLGATLKSMDDFLVSDRSLQYGKEQTTQLRSVRDRLLMKGIQLAGLLGNKEQVGSLINYSLQAQEKLNATVGREKLACGITHDVQAAEKLQRLFSTENLASALNLSAVEARTDLGNTINLNSTVVIYDKPSLQFLTADNKSLQLLDKFESIQVIAALGREDLKVSCSSYNLEQIVSSNVLVGYVESRVFNEAVASRPLDIVVLSTGGLNIIMNVLNSQNLGLAAQQ